MKPLWKFLVKLVEGKFWGKVTVHFEDGKPVRAIKEESVKF